MNNVVTIITSSPKHIVELQTAQRNEIEHMSVIGEHDSGCGVNQIGNLQQSGTTRWSSHYESIKSLIDIYAATCKVFKYLSDHSPNERSKAKVRGVYKNIASFEFVFILTAITFVSTTKTLLQELRECGWEGFLQEVKVFCSRNDIDMPDLDCLYKISRSREQTTVEHHYHFDVFKEAIDFILMELNTRFNELSIELFFFQCGFRS